MQQGFAGVDQIREKIAAEIEKTKAETENLKKGDTKKEDNDQEDNKPE